MPAVEDRSKKLASELHTLIKCKDFGRLEQLLDDSAAPFLWQPVIRSGWTPMHSAMRAMLSEQYYDSHWWPWILHKAACKPNFLTARDKSGETPMDIFFATWLSPPIGSSSAFRSFETSLRVVVGDDEMLCDIRQWVDAGQAPHLFPTRPEAQVLSRFYCALEWLCRAIDLHYGGDWSKPCRSVLHVLARSGSCPERVAAVIVRLFPENARLEPLPLHLWARAPPILSNDHGVLTPLLQCYPKAAGILDFESRSTNIGRYPLHVAVSQGKPLAQVDQLLTAYPSAVHATDPIGHRARLPTWALLAIAGHHARRRQARSRSTRPPSASLHEWLDSHSNAAREEELTLESDCEHLTLLYHCVRLLPDAIDYDMLR